MRTNYSFQYSTFDECSDFVIDVSGVTETMCDTVMNVTNGSTPNVTQAPINWTLSLMFQV